MATITRPRVWLERRRARAEADHWIGHGFESRYPWRVAELTAERERKLCARSLRSVVGEVDGTKLPGAAPLRTTSLRPHRHLLREIEGRLAGDGAVTATGMLAVHELLTSPGSCLFTEHADVVSCLRGVLAKLEPH
jgi:hypothetical protein